MNQRRGITLIEVLVTMFVMAIGFLALLVLFPLAALSMQQSIQDQRAAECARNAEAVANMYWDFRPANDDGPPPKGSPASSRHTGRFFLDANGNGGGPGVGDLRWDGPSHPIYIDPFGAASGMSQWIGGVSNGVHRLPTPWAGWNHNAEPVKYARYRGMMHWLPDDLPFAEDDTQTGENGRPRKQYRSFTTLVREGRYYWAYLLRRPRMADPGVVDMTIVVYSGRGLFASNNNSAGEIPVTLTSGGAKDDTFLDVKPVAGLHKGSWLIDVSPGSDPKFGPVNAFFYRVQKATPSGVSGDRRLDITPALRAPIQKGRLIFLDNVIEVFERGPGWQMPHWRNNEWFEQPLKGQDTP